MAQQGINTFFVNLRTQYGNSGDALINRELIKVLRSYGNVQAYCGPEVDRSFIADLQLLQEEKLEARNTLAFTFAILKCAIKSKAQVYSVGGLGDRYGGSKKDILRDYVAFCLFCIYRIFDIKIISIGRSLGKMTKGREISEKIRSIPINSYLVRDMQTLTYCRTIGIKKAIYCPDLSWLMPHEREQINQSSCVAITFRSAALGKKDLEYENVIIAKAKRLVSELQRQMNTKLKLVFFYQVKQDRAFMEQMYQCFSDMEEIEMVFLPERIRLKDMAMVYGDSVFHISNRLHSLLLGFKYGSLPIALVNEKNAKIVSTFTDTQQTDLLIDLNADMDSTCSKLHRICENRDELFQQIVRCEEKQCMDFKHMLERVLQ